MPKPSFLPAETFRNVLLRVHFYHVKEQILQAPRRADNTHPPYATLKFLPDLSRYTPQHRRNLATVTKALTNHKVLHKWKYPETLSITHEGVTKSVTTLEEGKAALQQWGIIPEQPSPSTQALQSPTLQND